MQKERPNWQRPSPNWQTSCPLCPGPSDTQRMCSCLSQSHWGHHWKNETEASTSLNGKAAIFTACHSILLHRQYTVSLHFPFFFKDSTVFCTVVYLPSSCVPGWSLTLCYMHSTLTYIMRCMSHDCWGHTLIALVMTAYNICYVIVMTVLWSTYVTEGAWKV